MSIARRFLFSLGANAARAVVSLLVGLLVARGLGPGDYGNLAFLLGSFWAVRALLDAGSSSAFFTFISQRHRDRAYYFIYFCWLTFQFVITVALVAAILPQPIVDGFWLGQERDTILLAFLATFLQNQVWQTVVQIHEASRLSVRIQIAGLLIVVVHLVLVVLMLSLGWLSIVTLLWAIIAEYLAAALWLSATLRAQQDGQPRPAGRPGALWSPAVLREYLHYCRPMVVIAIFTFLYEMTDRWLLQRFGGAIEQGFYQVASQLSTISLLAAASILNILWKEVAEANEKGNHARVIALYQRAQRFLLLPAAVVTCFFVPWAKPLVLALLGDPYLGSWPVLMLMLFYPLHQTMGQVNAMLFMSAGLTAPYMKITVAGLIASIPVSCLLLAPASGDGLTGLGLGAMGMAIKIVVLNILFVNLQAWIIARHYETAMPWAYQMTGPAVLLAIGVAARLIVEGLAPASLNPGLSGGKFSLFLNMTAAGLSYLAAIGIILWKFPRLLGIESQDMNAIFRKFARPLPG